MENLLNIKEVHWEFVYILSNDCTLDNTLKMFQYKLLHRTRLLSVTGSNMKQFDKIRNCIKPCKTFYKIFLKKYTERPINSQNKWKICWILRKYIGNLFTFCQMTVLLIIHWKCFSTSFSTEPSLQIHFCINVG
jgi:hypothetical protein